MKPRRLLIISLISALASPVFAQTDATPTHDDVLSLFNLMRVRDQVSMVMETIAKQQRTIVHDNLKRQSPRISPQDLARLDQFTIDILKDMPVEAMLDDMVPVYQRHLTKSDVDALITFYSSPAGQKLVREMPAMTLESMQAASPRLQEFMDKVMERAQAMAKERNGEDVKKTSPATNK